MRHLYVAAECPPRLLKAILARSEGPSLKRAVEGPGVGEDAVLTNYIARAKRDGLPSTRIVQDLDNRIKRYIAKIGYRDEGSRDNTAIQLARFLRVDLALDEPIALEYMSEWNSHNRPPLHPRIIQDKVTRARQGARRVVGCGL